VTWKACEERGHVKKERANCSTAKGNAVRNPGSHKENSKKGWGGNTAKYTFLWSGTTKFITGLNKGGKKKNLQLKTFTQTRRRMANGRRFRRGKGKKDAVKYDTSPKGGNLAQSVSGNKEGRKSQK